MGTEETFTTQSTLRGSGMGRRLLSYAIGVPSIAVLYLIVVLYMRSFDRSRFENPVLNALWDFLGMVLISPAYHFSEWFPAINRWQHGLGIALLFGALWGIFLVTLGWWLVRRIARAHEATQEKGKCQ